MKVPNFLVPFDAKMAGTPSAQENSKTGAPGEALPFARESKQVGLAIPKEVFAEAMLENSPTRPPRRVADFVVSGTVQVLLLAVLLVVPLYFSEALDTHQLNPTFACSATSRSSTASSRVATVGRAETQGLVGDREVARADRHTASGRSSK